MKTITDLHTTDQPFRAPLPFAAIGLGFKKCLPSGRSIGLLFQSAKQLALHFLLVIAIACGLATSNADPASSETLAKIWAASLQAESDKNYDDALDQVISYQQQGGDRFLASIRGGWLCYLKKDYDQATIYYTRANQMQPNALNPLLGLLNVAQAQKDNTKVMSVANTIMRVEPTNYRAQMALAGASYANKDYRGALSSYMRVLVYYPEDVDAMSGAAWASYYLADPERAFQGFSKILSISPDYPYAQQGYSLTAGKTTGNSLQGGRLQPSTGVQPSSGL